MWDRRRQTDTEPLAIWQLLVEERALWADILPPQRAGEVAIDSRSS